VQRLREEEEAVPRKEGAGVAMRWHLRRMQVFGRYRDSR